jgi:hypothetical protein
MYVISAIGTWGLFSDRSSSSSVSGLPPIWPHRLTWPVWTHLFHARHGFMTRCTNWSSGGPTLTKVRVDNLHYDITESELEVRLVNSNDCVVSNRHCPTETFRRYRPRPRTFPRLWPRWTLRGRCLHHIRETKRRTQLCPRIWRC